MIKVGPAGSDGLGNLKGVQKAAELGLDCMEVEFTYGVRMDHKTAKAVLKSFGVQKVQDLAAKDYQRCIDRCHKEAA